MCVSFEFISFSHFSSNWPSIQISWQIHFLNHQRKNIQTHSDTHHPTYEENRIHKYCHLWLSLSIYPIQQDICGFMTPNEKLVNHLVKKNIFFFSNQTFGRLKNWISPRKYVILKKFIICFKILKGNSWLNQTCSLSRWSSIFLKVT